MSRLLINDYYRQVSKIVQYGGSKNEGSISGAFKNLLNGYCETKGFILVDQLDYQTKFNTTLRPDGTIKDALRLDWGYWKSKDEFDDLDIEIENKFKKGYPDIVLTEDNSSIPTH